MKALNFTNDELNLIMDALNDVIEHEMTIETENGPTLRGEMAYHAYEKIENVHTYKADRKIIPIGEAK